MKKIQIAFFTLLIAVSSSVFAQTTYGKGGQVELSPFFGVNFTDDYGTIHPKRAPIVGLRLGYFFTPSFSLDASAQRAFSEMDTATNTSSIDMDGYRMNVYWNIQTGIKLVPFLTAGGGYERFSSTLTGAQHDWGYNGGLGFRFYASDNAGLRVDARYVSAKVNVPPAESWQSNIETSLGLFFLFGKRGPQDKDKDGVLDEADKCPNTPVGTKVGADGCPIKDSDNDTVLDDVDQCPGTPPGSQVDAVGCILDEDKDGVSDLNDKCPATPAGATVDLVGCPLDSDMDKVSDYLDKCPNTPIGTQVDDMGCPLQSKARGVLKGVVFQSGSPKLLPNAFGVLDMVAAELKKFPEVKVEIQGHTDSTGQPATNLALSQKRAETVMNYLATQGVPKEQMTAKGYGQSAPIGSNKTKDGRGKNRRVEIKWLD